MILSGEVDGQTWSDTEITQSVFENVSFSRMKWLDGRIANSYVKGGRFDQIEFDRTEWSALDFLRASITDVDFTDGTAASLLIDRSTVSRLGLMNTNVDAVRVDRSEVNELRLENSPVSDLTFDSSKVVGFKIAGAPLGRFQTRATDLRDLEFSTLAWNGGGLTGGSLESARLSSVTLQDVKWEGVSLKKLTLENASLRSFQLVNPTNAFGIEMTDTKVITSRLAGAKIDALKLTNVSFYGTRFQDLKISNSELTRVHFENSDLSGLTLGDRVRFIDCTYTESTTLPFTREYAASIGLKLVK